MTKARKKRIMLIGAGVLIIAAVVYGFIPAPLPVETAVATVGSMRVIIEEEGETSVKRHYAVTAPVAAYARRIELEPGDEVVAGQPLVQLEPPRSPMLDPRSAAQAAARVDGAAAAAALAEERVGLTVRELQRMKRLFEAGSVTASRLEQAETELEQARAAHNKARAELTAARAAVYDLWPVDSTLTPDSSAPAAPGRVTRILRSPAAGRVLAVHRRSEGHVQPGEPLLDIGDTDLLEVHVPVLSRDAVRITGGTGVELDRWGGDELLEATVTRVERQGRVVVSALGVEERRVKVVAELVSPPELRRTLGSGYRVLARFVVWQDDAALQIPTGALFRSHEGWAVFVAEDKRAVRREVTVGRQSGLTAQVTSGLAEGDTVIVHPPSELKDGDRVEPGQRAAR